MTLDGSDTNRLLHGLTLSQTVTTLNMNLIYSVKIVEARGVEPLS